ncbi:MAG: ABC transporter permease [Verrucomicrobiota bacterium]|nr:ABC transporter permease [Verrucomicrobiota bacterium]
MSEKSKFGAIFILLIVFAIGSLFGIGSTIFYLKQAHDRPHRTPRDIYRVQVDRMTSRLERSLELTEDQVPLVRQEIAKFGEAMKELNKSMMPEFRALMDERAIAIEQHLSQEQLPVFRENRKQHQIREKARREKEREGKKPSAWKPKWNDNPWACQVFISSGTNC